MVNHSWHVTLKTTTTGLTTESLPFNDFHFQIDLDLIHHKAKLSTSEGGYEDFDLPRLIIAEFYTKLFETLRKLDIYVKIFTRPVELVDPIRFDEDTTHQAYNSESITALHKSLLAAEEIFTAFRCGFKDKASAVHFSGGALIKLSLCFQERGLLSILEEFRTWPTGLLGRLILTK